MLTKVKQIQLVNTYTPALSIWIIAGTLTRQSSNARYTFNRQGHATDLKFYHLIFDQTPYF